MKADTLKSCIVSKQRTSWRNLLKLCKCLHDHCLDRSSPPISFLNSAGNRRAYLLCNFSKCSLKNAIFGRRVGYYGGCSDSSSRMAALLCEDISNLLKVFIKRSEKLNLPKQPRRSSPGPTHYAGLFPGGFPY